MYISFSRKDLLTSHRRSYSIVQRATSDTIRYGSMVCEPLPCDEEFETYIDDTEYEKFPEY